MAKDVYYFSHDANARHDPKITAMRSVYGAEGYGWFWILVEMMREAEGFKLPATGKYIWNAYAKQMECKDVEEAHIFISDCINEFDLFQSDGEYFWSASLMKRMGKREEVREKRRAAAQARWGKSEEQQGIEGDSQNVTDANGMQMHSKSNANGMQGKERKGKERKEKGKEIIKTVYAEFVSMTEDEYQKLIDKHGETDTARMIEILDNYKGANKKKYASDYRAILNWVVDRVAEEKRKGGGKGGTGNGQTTSGSDSYSQYNFGF